MKYLLLILALLVGCAEDPFVEEPTERTASFIIDRSGSFETLLKDQAHPHLIKAVTKFCRAGARDRVVFSQISGGETVLLDASPRAFLHKFPTAESFSAFLDSQPGNGSSPVFQSCSATIERLCRMHEASPGMKSIVLIYSDMDDTHGGEDLFKAALKRYAAHDGAVGMYWVNDGTVEYWKQVLSESGVRHFVVRSDKELDPPLPQI